MEGRLKAVLYRFGGICDKQSMTRFIFDGSDNADATIMLAHGAGAAMDSDWMNEMAAVLAAKDFRVLRFEFAYMAARREGLKPPPAPANRLIGEYLAAVDAVTDAGKLIIGGKSLGGRMASMIADQLYAKSRIAGLLCLGYPFHPPGNPQKLRTDHLENLRTPTLICQGERDPFGTREEVQSYPLSPAIELMWLADGDHGFAPRKSSGLTLPGHMEAVAARVKTWTSTMRS